MAAKKLGRKIKVSEPHEHFWEAAIFEYKKDSYQRVTHSVTSYFYCKSCLAIKHFDEEEYKKHLTK